MYDVQFDFDDKQRKIAESTTIIAFGNLSSSRSAVYDQRIC